MSSLMELRPDSFDPKRKEWQDLHSTSFPEFVQNIPASSIEDAVVEILQKYGVICADPTLGYYDPTLGYDATIGYSDDKTFTLDDIINLITTMPVEMHINHGGVFEFKQKQLIDKDELLKRLKQL